MTDAAPHPLRVLAAFGLAGEVTAYAEVSGGWSNRVWRLSSTRGDYAVKEVRNAWGEPRWLEWLDEGWRTECAAIAAGIRAPAPVAAPDGGCLAHVERADGSGVAPVRVHRWVEAATVPRAPVGLPLARWVGATLASLHRLALQPLVPELFAGRIGLTTVDVWPGLVARSRAAAAPWTDALEEAEPLARRASALLVDDDSPTVLAHGDIDQKNLLVGADGPLLIDWDVVLPLAPAQDVAHAAVTMAAWREPAVGAAVMRGYRDAGGAVTALAPTDIGPALASRLGWIRFTIDRALDAAGDPAAGVGVAAGGIADLLDQLAHRVALAEQFPAWLASPTAGR